MMAENSKAITGVGKARGPGRPFQPGQTGNPGGRPRGLAQLIRENTNNGQELVDFLLLVLRSTGPQGYRTDHRIAAAKELLDRGFGKAVQQVEHSGEIGAPTTAPGLESFTLEELRQLIAVADAREGQDSPELPETERVHLLPLTE